MYYHEEGTVFCANCQKRPVVAEGLLASHHFKRCSVCKSVWYCDPICQREHWRSIHRHECKLPPRPARPERDLIRVLWVLAGAALLIAALLGWLIYRAAPAAGRNDNMPWEYRFPPPAPVSWKTPQQCQQKKTQCLFSPQHPQARRRC